MPNVTEIYASLIDDPDVIPPKDVSKEDYALMLAQQRMKQHANNEKALNLGLTKLLKNTNGHSTGTAVNGHSNGNGRTTGTAVKNLASFVNKDGDILEQALLLMLKKGVPELFEHLRDIGHQKFRRGSNPIKPQGEGKDGSGLKTFFTGQRFSQHPDTALTHAGLTNDLVYDTIMTRQLGERDAQGMLTGLRAILSESFGHLNALNSLTQDMEDNETLEDRLKRHESEAKAASGDPENTDFTRLEAGLKKFWNTDGTFKAAEHIQKIKNRAVRLKQIKDWADGKGIELPEDWQDHPDLSVENDQRGREIKLDKNRIDSYLSNLEGDIPTWPSDKGHALKNPQFKPKPARGAEPQRRQRSQAQAGPRVSPDPTEEDDFSEPVAEPAEAADTSMPTSSTPEGFTPTINSPNDLMNLSDEELRQLGEHHQSSDRAIDAHIKDWGSGRGDRSGLVTSLGRKFDFTRQQMNDAVAGGTGEAGSEEADSSERTALVPEVEDELRAVYDDSGFAPDGPNEGIEGDYAHRSFDERFAAGEFHHTATGRRKGANALKNAAKAFQDGREQAHTERGGTGEADSSDTGDTGGADQESAEDPAWPSTTMERNAHKHIQQYLIADAVNRGLTQEDGEAEFQRLINDEGLGSEGNRPSGRDAGRDYVKGWEQDRIDDPTTEASPEGEGASSETDQRARDSVHARLRTELDAMNPEQRKIRLDRLAESAGGAERLRSYEDYLGRQGEETPTESQDRGGPPQGEDPEGEPVEERERTITSGVRNHLKDVTGLSDDEITAALNNNEFHNEDDSRISLANIRTKFPEPESESPELSDLEQAHAAIREHVDAKGGTFNAEHPEFQGEDIEDMDGATDWINENDDGGVFTSEGSKRIAQGHLDKYSDKIEAINAEMTPIDHASPTWQKEYDEKMNNAAQEFKDNITVLNQNHFNSDAWMETAIQAQGIRRPQIRFQRGTSAETVGDEAAPAATEAATSEAVSEEDFPEETDENKRTIENEEGVPLLRFASTRGAIDTAKRYGLMHPNGTYTELGHKFLNEIGDLYDKGAEQIINTDIAEGQTKSPRDSANLYILTTKNEAIQQANDKKTNTWQKRRDKNDPTHPSYTSSAEPAGPEPTLANNQLKPEVDADYNLTDSTLTDRTITHSTFVSLKDALNKAQGTDEAGRPLHESHNWTPSYNPETGAEETGVLRRAERNRPQVDHSPNTLFNFDHFNHEESGKQKLTHALFSNLIGAGMPRGIGNLAIVNHEAAWLALHVINAGGTTEEGAQAGRTARENAITEDEDGNVVADLSTVEGSQAQVEAELGTADHISSPIIGSGNTPDFDTMLDVDAPAIEALRQMTGGEEVPTLDTSATTPDETLSPEARKREDQLKYSEENGILDHILKDPEHHVEFMGDMDRLKEHLTNLPEKDFHKFMGAKSKAKVAADDKADKDEAKANEKAAEKDAAQASKATEDSKKGKAPDDGSDVKFNRDNALEVLARHQNPDASEEEILDAIIELNNLYDPSTGMGEPELKAEVKASHAVEANTRKVKAIEAKNKADDRAKVSAQLELKEFQSPEDFAKDKVNNPDGNPMSPELATSRARELLGFWHENIDALKGSEHHTAAGEILRRYLDVDGVDSNALNSELKEMEAEGSLGDKNKMAAYHKGRKVAERTIESEATAHKIRLDQAIKNVHADRSTDKEGNPIHHRMDHAGELEAVSPEDAEIEHTDSEAPHLGHIDEDGNLDETAQELYRDLHEARQQIPTAPELKRKQKEAQAIHAKEMKEREDSHQEILDDIENDKEAAHKQVDDAHDTALDDLDRETATVNKAKIDEHKSTLARYDSEHQIRQDYLDTLVDEQAKATDAHASQLERIDDHHVGRVQDNLKENDFQNKLITDATRQKRLVQQAQEQDWNDIHQEKLESLGERQQAERDMHAGDESVLADLKEKHDSDNQQMREAAATQNQSNAERSAQITAEHNDGIQQMSDEMDAKNDDLQQQRQEARLKTGQTLEKVNADHLEAINANRTERGEKPLTGEQDIVDQLQMEKGAASEVHQGRREDTTEKHLQVLKAARLEHERVQQQLTEEHETKKEGIEAAAKGQHDDNFRGLDQAAAGVDANRDAAHAKAAEEHGFDATGKANQNAAEKQEAFVNHMKESGADKSAISAALSKKHFGKTSAENEEDHEAEGQGVHTPEEQRAGSKGQTKMVDDPPPPGNKKQQVWVPGRGKGWVDKDKMDAATSNNMDAAGGKPSGKMMIYPAGAEGNPFEGAMAGHGGNWHSIETDNPLASGHPEAAGHSHEDVIAHSLGNSLNVAGHDMSGDQPFEVNASDHGFGDSEHGATNKRDPKEGTPEEASQVFGEKAQARATDVGSQLGVKQGVQAYTGAMDWLKRKTAESGTAEKVKEWGKEEVGKFKADVAREKATTPDVGGALARGLRGGRHQRERMGGGKYPRFGPFQGFGPGKQGKPSLKREAARHLPKWMQSSKTKIDISTENHEEVSSAMKDFKDKIEQRTKDFKEERRYTE